MAKMTNLAFSVTGLWPVIDDVYERDFHAGDLLIIFARGAVDLSLDRNFGKPSADKAKR